MILKINDRIRIRKIEFWNDFHVNLKYDSLASTFSFKFYFNPDNIEHKEMACIGHYHTCTVEHNKELLITGQILSEGFNSAAERSPVTIGGYSLPGILEDCSITPNTASAIPLSPGAGAGDIAVSMQYNGLGLREIAEQVIKPFGLSIVIDPIVAQDMEDPFTETEGNISQTVKSFLSQLASQKNIVLSHNAKGQIVFTRAPLFQKPIFNFTKDLPTTSMSLGFNGQAMHSHIYVVAQADVNDSDVSSSEPIRNPYVINTVYRPKVVVQTSKSIKAEVDPLLAGKNARAQELKGLSLKIVTDRWILNDKIIRPGQLISVINPEVYLYKKTNWIIEEVDLVGDKKKTTATLTCVLPECYNGAEPNYIFQGINLH